MTATYRMQVRVHRDFTRGLKGPVVVPILADCVERQLAATHCARLGHDTDARARDEADESGAKRTGVASHTLQGNRDRVSAHEIDIS
jgi:hypothetical protein